MGLEVQLHPFRHGVYTRDLRPTLAQFVEQGGVLTGLIAAAVATRWWERSPESYAGEHVDARAQYDEIAGMARDMAAADRAARKDFLRAQASLMVGPLCVPRYGAPEGLWPPERTTPAFHAWLDAADPDLHALITLQRPLQGETLEFSLGEATEVATVEEANEIERRVDALASLRESAAWPELQSLREFLRTLHEEDNLRLALAVL